jgi:hypothetical protein
MLVRVVLLVMLSLSPLGCATQAATSDKSPNSSPTPDKSRQASSERALAALMRVTIDGEAANRNALEKSFNYESILLRHAGDAGFRYVDITPLKADFQRLRYSHQCPIVDGNYSRDDCANFGNYAESVLEILANIDQATIDQHLPQFGAADRILLGDTQIINFERRIRVEMYMRVYSAQGQELVYNDTLSREMQLGSKATREGMTIKLLNLVIADGIRKFAE